MELTQLHSLFEKGKFRQLVDELFDSPKRKKLSQGDIVSLVAALSFLGRMDEANALFQSSKKTVQQKSFLVACRFFLGISYYRIAQIDKAKEFFLLNEQTNSENPMDNFFIHQGQTFQFYYLGQYSLAVSTAMKARDCAIYAESIYARVLSTDALGVINVNLGNINKGLMHLEEAKNLSLKLGNISTASSIATTSIMVKSEAGKLGKNSIQELENHLSTLAAEDTFAYSNLCMEIARQSTLRGDYLNADRVLKNASDYIYAQNNRRHEMQLNLRWAELFYQKGDTFQAKHFVRSAKRLVDENLDKSYLLRILAFEIKLADSSDQKSKLTREWIDFYIKMKNESYGTFRDQNFYATLKSDRSFECVEDEVYLVRKKAAELLDKSEKIELYLDHLFLTDIRDELNLSKARRIICEIPNEKGLLILDKDVIRYGKKPLTPTQRKILESFSKGVLSKEDLVKRVWGYKYNSLRHDPMVYSAISGLRKDLGEASSWVQIVEEGYFLDAEFKASSEKVSALLKESVDDKALEEADALPLNHRQLQIIDWMRREHSFLSVNDCKKRFKRSEITCLRDLDGLRKLGLVMRVGKARATRYMLKENYGGSLK
ncbi:MAG: hypothetical protein M9962_00655 [Oligoflexia bacterium]|nr:hypothetical protein [Oligoflexia bacterium]